MNISWRDTAVVFIDPQNEVLSDKGLAWGAVGDSVRENKTVENMECIFQAAKEKGFEVFISPHYFYPTDSGWKFNGPLDTVEQETKMFARSGALSLDGFSGLGANRPGAKVSQGLRDSFWLQGMLAGHRAVFDCIKAFSETDFTEDLKKFDVPTLILHGDDDQIVPIGASALLSSKLVKRATLKIYPGAPHGMCSTHKDRVTADLVDFLGK